MKLNFNRLFAKFIQTAYQPTNKFYYWLVKNIINNFEGHKLHLTKFGDFISGTSKTRSLYREDMLLKTFLLFVDFRGKSCVDLACNEGFWSFKLGGFGLKSLIGVDGYKPVIERANFLKTVYNFNNFKFLQQAIEPFLFTHNTDTFDIVLLMSILYHLPENTDWERFFGTISKINNECLIIDSRWFENDEYYYDKESLGQAKIKTHDGEINKWRPKRKEVFKHLTEHGYAKVIEINPSVFLQDTEKAFGNGDPYTLENVSDYITNNRTIIIAYKNEAFISNFGKLLADNYDFFKLIA